MRQFAEQTVGTVWFELPVFLLIVLSVVLVISELTHPQDSQARTQIEHFQRGLTFLFVLELTWRRLSMHDWPTFFKRCWVDIIAILPGFQPAKLTGTLRLVRLLRLLRLVRVVRWFLRKTGGGTGQLIRLAESLAIFLLLWLPLTLGTIGLAGYEHDFKYTVPDTMEAFWRTIFTFFSSQYSEEYPKSLGGKAVALLVIAAGSAFFAIMIGFTSAVISQKLKEGTLRLDAILFRELKDHIVVCGWNPGAYMALRELQSSKSLGDRDIVLLLERAEMPDLSLLPNPSRVRLVQDDFTRVSALKRAGIERAAVAIIVTDLSGNRNPQDADARTVLCALTIEKLNSKVVTCAELAASENESHLRMGKVDDVIVTSEVSGGLLAQAAISALTAKLVRHLLHPESASRILEFPLEPEWAGKTFGGILSEYHKKTGRLPVAVQSARGSSCLNPGERVLEVGDLLLCIVGASEFGQDSSGS